MKFLSIVASIILLSSFDPGDDEKLLTRDQEIHIQNVFYHTMAYPDEILTENQELVVVVHFQVNEGKMEIVKIDSQNTALRDYIIDNMENSEVGDDVPQGVEFAIPVRFKKE